MPMVNSMLHVMTSTQEGAGAHGISECMGLWPGEEGRGKINIPLCKHQDGAPSAKPYHARSNDCDQSKEQSWPHVCIHTYI